MFCVQLASELLKSKLASRQLQFSELDTLITEFEEAAKLGTHMELGWQNSAYGGEDVFGKLKSCFWI